MIRSATPADRTALGAMLATSFGKREADWFLVNLPHLFTESRIGQHALAIEDGSIIGCVGCYPFAATLHGAPLRIAGIGQVATLPQARGKGLMTGLLDHALGAAGDCDLFWLYGDRQRYGRVGFAPGGARIDGRTWDRYAPPRSEGPPIRALVPASEPALVERLLARLPLVVQQVRPERLVMLAGKKAGGWTDGSATILLGGGGRTVWAAEGDPAAIARLVAHQVEQLRLLNPADTAVRIQADPADVTMCALLRDLAGEQAQVASCMLRVGRLLPLLTAWAAAHPPLPGVQLRPTVLDGGSAGRVRIACASDAWTITTTSDPADLMLAGTPLAELVFGLTPVRLVGLPADAALAHLLPLSFNIPECYGL